MHFREVEFEKDVTLRPKQVEHLQLLVDRWELQRMYETAVSVLNHRHCMATIRTHAEVEVAKMLSKATRLQVFPSVWIGRCCVDFLIPSVGGEPINGRRRMNGVVIEVNGPVHNHELKMRKDEIRSELLTALGIGLIVMENADLGHPANQALIRQIKAMPRLPSRSRQRLWRRIQAWTIIANELLYVGGADERA